MCTLQPVRYISTAKRPCCQPQTWYEWGCVITFPLSICSSWLLTAFVLYVVRAGMPCTTSNLCPFVHHPNAVLLGWVSISVSCVFYLRLFSNLLSISTIRPLTGPSQEQTLTTILTWSRNRQSGLPFSLY